MMKNKFLQPILTKISLAVAFGTVLISQKALAVQLLPGSVNNIKQVRELIQNATNIALGVAGAVAGIYILLGGFEYLTAYGDQAKADNGKKTLTFAIIGLVIIILSKLIVDALWKLLADPSIKSGL